MSKRIVRRARELLEKNAADVAQVIEAERLAGGAPMLSRIVMLTWGDAVLLAMNELAGDVGGR